MILDVVFNHTREGNHFGPTMSFKGLDNNIYYMLAPKPEFYMDFTGCGNTLNCNHPVVRRVHPRLPPLLGHGDARRRLPLRPRGRLRHRRRPAGEGEDADHRRDRERPRPRPHQADRRALEHHASIASARSPTAAGPSGTASSATPSAAGSRATAASSATSPARVAGSYDLFTSGDDRSARRTTAINFITCHDGFTLNDLVSYNDKHNIVNGEGNRDGSNDNNSWNCGVEGPTADSRGQRSRPSGTSRSRTS